jgi:biopolymer transport protein ExbD
MKFIKSYHYLIAALLVLSTVSCQKVINVDLKETDKKLVIDAVLTDHEGGCVVKLSQTKEFYDDNSFVGISGAQVTISSNGQLLSTLHETSQGVYIDSDLKGNYGKVYELSVVLNGKSYSAVSTMPYLVPFDSAYAKTQSFFGNNYTFATVMLQDPVDTQNNYRCIQYVNGKRTKGNFILDDDYSDGKRFESTLYFDQNDVDSIKSGDEIRIDLLGIDRPTYEYWFSFEQSASGGQGSAAPANPVSNIKGDALGYFSVQNTQTKTIIAP